MTPMNSCAPLYNMNSQLLEKIVILLRGAITLAALKNQAVLHKMERGLMFINVLSWNC